ncbi:MAG TPA: 3-oxoacyl-[acyl-carrier-protein] synthase III C-terminal domain-containing protein [Actinotalea sp.]
MSHVVRVVPALPSYVYPQAEITATIAPLLVGADSERRHLVDRLHAASGVSTRHLALPLEAYPALTSFGVANDHFIRLGTELAEQASRAALDDAGLTGQDVDHLLFTSVTGMSAPSIDALLVPRLGLRDDVRRIPSFGLGCVAGAAGLARVHDYLQGHPDQAALLVAVELCSLTVQHGDDSMANLVSSAIFGDGAAAALLVGDDHRLAQGSPLAVVDSRSVLYPDTADQLGWHIGASGLRIVLSAALSDVIRTHLADDVTRLLEPHDLKARDITTWVVHAGGPRIIDAVQEALDLDATALVRTRESLAEVGNLSSVSVLDVLARTLDAPRPAAGHMVLLAFGPGVSAELVLLRWKGDA